MIEHPIAVDILLIEDNMEDADLTIRALTKENLHNKILHLEDGEEALDFISEGENLKNGKNGKLPRLIMLDLKIPKVHGLHVLKEIKNNERTKRVPVVIFTSSNQETDVNTAYDLGANAYIVKPLDITEYNRVISEVSSFWININYIS